MPKPNFRRIKLTRGREYSVPMAERLNDSLQYLPIKQRAIVLADMMEESGLDPLAKSAGDEYQGLLQWGADRYKITSDDREKELTKQLQNLRNTINDTTDSKSWTHGGKGSGYNTLKDAYIAFNDTTNTLDQMHRGFSFGYVRPTGKEDSHQNRLKVAQQVYNRMLEAQENNPISQDVPAYNDGFPWKSPQNYVPPKVTSDTYNDGMPVLKSEGGQIEKRKLWDDLSIAEKSEIMKVAIQNGITSLQDIKAKYNEFAEGGPKNNISDGQYYDIMEKVAEQNYKDWGYNNPDEALVHMLNDNTYNYRGYYNEFPNGDGNALDHWPDKYKTAYHPTFSDESIYSEKTSEYNSTGRKGGHWLKNNYDFFIPSISWNNKFAKGGPADEGLGTFGRQNPGNRFDGTSQPSQQMDRGPYITRGVAENGTPYYTGTYSPELQSYLDPVWFDENGEYNIGLPEVTVRPSGEQLANSGREKAFGYIGPIVDAAASFNPLWGTISGVAHGLESAKDIYDNGLNLGNALGVGLGIGLPVVHVPRLYNKGIQAITKNGNKIVKANVTTKNISNSSKLPFESELDWSPEGWLSKRENGIYDAEDVAALQSHIPEYIGIEKAAKENNTWLKLPDGSIWQGDPRSWVQLQSKDGKKLIMRELFHGNDDRYIGSGGIDETPNVLGRKALWTSTNPNVPLTYGRHKYIFTIPKGTEGIEYDAKGANWNRIEHKPGFKVDTNDIARTFADDNNVLIIRNVVDRGADPRPRPGVELPSYLPKETLSDYNKRVFLGDDYIIGKNISRKSLLGNNGNFDLSNPNIYKGITPFAVSTLFLEPQR